MPHKLPKRAMPDGHTRDDFTCFGPPAVSDGAFSGTKIADLGCFAQEKVDSNKYYHAAVVQSTKTQQFYAYTEWGREGHSVVDFQFIACGSEDEAQREYETVCTAKNVKRGKWTTVNGIRVLEPKPGQDLYLVRPLSRRNRGLPDGYTISVPTVATASSATAKPNAPVAATSAPVADAETLALLNDLNLGTVAYTRQATAGGAIPTQSAIDEGRALLAGATSRIAAVPDVQAQLLDAELVKLSTLLYSRIGKAKPLKAGPAHWVLTSQNVVAWQQDLDAFESALHSTLSDSSATVVDPFANLPLTMSHVKPSSTEGSWLYGWAPTASRRMHHYKSMTIHNAWRVARHGDEARLFRKQDELAGLDSSAWVKESPLHQPQPSHGSASVPCTPPARASTYARSNSALLFHGTRSVNVSGILRKSLMLPQQLVGVAITGTVPPEWRSLMIPSNRRHMMLHGAGALFGPGIYLADDYMKSAGYTSLSNSYWAQVCAPGP
jgi:hypothetical protein